MTERATDTPDAPVRLVGERENQLLGLFGALSAALIVAGLLAGSELPWPYAAAAGAIVGAVTYRRATRRFRRRRWLARQPFPAAWTEVLSRDVPLVHALDAAERARLERRIRVFLDEKRITGIGVELDTRKRVLVAASAVIPTLGLPSWEYDELGEVLLYGQAFSRDFEQGEREGVIGMVGSGAMDRVMILSRPHLEAGFSRPTDKHNVGYHEFAHLIDKADGVVDGIPAAVLETREIDAWVALMERERARLARGEGILDDYGLTNEAELFAVATEAFFEDPDALAQHHPELFATLRRVLRIDLRSRWRAALRSTWRPRGQRLPRRAPCPCGSGKRFGDCCLSKEEQTDVGRNDPCPCGSGKKFKQCCLGKRQPKR